jgi:spore germination cell wall hydrolase CwlJ-like protein
MKRYQRLAVCAVAVTAISWSAMTTTHCADDRTKPVAEKPTFSYLSCRGTSTQEHDIVPLEDVEPMPEKPYTEDELEALALVIYQEAGSDACSDATRYMVGTVVLNRVASDRFPNTIEEVLLQERQYGRLAWTGLVWPDRASRPGEAHAVERAYRQAAELLDGTVTDVLPVDVIFQCEYVLGEIVAESDGFYFCK